MLKATTKWKKLTTWWAPSPQTYWHLRIANVNPCDTALLPHHQPIRKLCRSWSQTLGHPSLTWPLKMPCWNPSGSSGLFEHEPPTILVCLASLGIRHMHFHSVTKGDKKILPFAKCLPLTRQRAGWWGYKDEGKQTKLHVLVSSLMRNMGICERSHKQM